MQKKQILEKIYQNFRDKTGYGIVIGVEQEFYYRVDGIGDSVQENLHCEESNKVSMTQQSSVNNEESPSTSQPLLALNKALSPFPFFSEVEEEKGEGQFEIQISPTDNPAVMADMVELLRMIVNSELCIGKHPPSTTHHPHAFFAAKPFPTQPASGMHININLIDESGQNVFSKNGEYESEQLNNSIAGLLELMPASMKYFAPYEEAYVRYTEHGMESPSTISWGADNRTASLRIPSVPLTPHARRLEHRVPCADADPYLTIAAIIVAIEFGIINKLENKHPKIWGNAFLPQYGLPKLPHSFAEAKNISHEFLHKTMRDFK